MNINMVMLLTNNKTIFRFRGENLVTV
jgi:hypothetical protein